MVSEFVVQGKYGLAANLFEKADKAFNELDKEYNTRGDLDLRIAEHRVRKTQLQQVKVSRSFALRKLYSCRVATLPRAMN